MIINKTIYKWASILLLCALLVSCGASEDILPPLELLEEPLPDESEAPPDLYCVVVPSDCSATVWDAAQTLAEAIADRTGVDCERTYEHERVSETKAVFFLYLGWVRSSPEASRRIRRLKRDDYLCRRVETGIVLGGKTDAATLAAADRFAREILPAATASMLMHPDGGFSYASEDYAIDTAKLNGFDLHEYTVVYPANASEALRGLAKALRDEIAARSGYFLELLPEDRFDPVSKGIFIGTEAPLQEGDSAYWIPRDNGVLLTARSFFGISVATEQFCSHLLPADAAEDRSLTVSTTRAFVYTDGPYRLFSVLSEGILPFQTPDEITQIVDPILTRDSHAAFLGRVPAEQVKYLSESLDDYGMLSWAAEGDAPLTAYAKEGVVTLLDSVEQTGTGVTVSAFWVGDLWNGFRVLYVSGSLIKDYEGSLTELCGDGAEEPTVILAHILTGDHEASWTDADGFHAIVSETYAAVGDAYAFFCYTTSEQLRVSVEYGTQGSAHRFVTVERTSAF